MGKSDFKVVLACLVLCSIFTGFLVVRDKSWQGKIQPKGFRLTSAFTTDYMPPKPWRAVVASKHTVPSSTNKIFDVEELNESTIALTKDYMPPKPRRAVVDSIHTVPSSTNKIFDVEVLNESSIAIETDFTKDYTHLEPWIAEVDSKHTVPNSNSKIFEVELWSDCFIGLYLWEHILGGSLEKGKDGQRIYGTKTVENIKFTFRVAKGLVAKPAKNVLIIVDDWRFRNMSHLQNVGLILLGNEDCKNSWLHDNMHYNGGFVKFAFIVYDSPEIDNVNFYQWPLGVSLNRGGFPIVESSKIQVTVKRKYICNFFGTVYKNISMSRQTLLKILEESDLLRKNCLVKVRRQRPRMDWKDSVQPYIEALSQSDLTLNPVGGNTECYRIYEAMSYGSIPVVEDVMTPGLCGKCNTSNKCPFRLLKEMDAPIIYIKDWSELTKVIENEKKLKHSEKVKRRRNILQWYDSFKSKMGRRLIGAINRHFFGLDK